MMENGRKWRTRPGEILGQGPVIPVIVIPRLEQAVPLARALTAGGIRVLEITLRTPAAMEAISAIRREVPEAIVGAGTVTNAAELEAVTAAGAAFAISPGLTAELLEAANRGPIPLVPGIATVSELMTGLDRGYDHFKFFPAGLAGGVKMLQSFAGPFSQVTFCPTGGIGAENYREYLALPNVACVGGSWIAPRGAIERGEWGQITELARTAVSGAGPMRRS
jgi:2-dehydro-3-deoxyphosphogluconate aldolase/(4S)-4-hydroxy-2-oxoglutarate aldolase